MQTIRVNLDGFNRFRRDIVWSESSGATMTAYEYISAATGRGDDVHAVLTLFGIDHMVGDGCWRYNRAHVGTLAAELIVAARYEGVTISDGADAVADILASAIDTAEGE